MWKLIIVVLSLLLAAPMVVLHGGKDATSSRIGTMEEVNVAKRLVVFWYSLGEGKGLPGERNRALETLRLDKDCKVTVDEKPIAWQSLPKGYEIKVVYKGDVAYRIEAFSPGFQEALRKDLARGDAIGKAAAKKSASESNYKGLPSEVRPNKFAAGRKNAGVRITTPEPAIFLMLNGAMAPGQLLYLDAIHVRSVVQARMYDYPADWYVAIQTSRNVYLFDRDKERFEIATTEQIRALQPFVDKIKSAHFEEAIRQWKEAIPRRNSGASDRAAALWKMLSPGQKEKAKAIGADMLRGWWDNTSSVVRDTWSGRGGGGTVVTITGRVDPTLKFASMRWCYADEPHSGWTPDISLSHLAPNFSISCQANRPIEIWVVMPLMGGGKKFKHTPTKDKNIGTVYR